MDGFNPFDTLAAAAVNSPSLMECETLPVRAVAEAPLLSREIVRIRPNTVMTKAGV